MAKVQTRKSVSLNRSVYEAAMREAEQRGMTLAGLVESALGSIGVPIAEHPRQTRAQAHSARAAEKPRDTKSKRPSRERQVLGDEAADAHGFA